MSIWASMGDDDDIEACDMPLRTDDDPGGLYVIDVATATGFNDLIRLCVWGHANTAEREPQEAEVVLNTENARRLRNAINEALCDIDRAQVRRAAKAACPGPHCQCSR